MDLVPALTVLCGVYVFHQYRKWQDAKAEVAAVAAEARQAHERSRELERLVNFGRALAKALDMSALPETPLAGAEQVAEALRQEIAQLRHPVDRSLVISASLGVASASEAEFDAKALIARADDALYRAKKAGRNRVEVAAASLPEAAHYDVPISGGSIPAWPLHDDGPLPTMPRHSLAVPVMNVA